MRKSARLILSASIAAALLGASAIQTVAIAADVENGKKVATHRKKGNCGACHAFDGVAYPGTVGPPLVAMKARFPDKAKLRAQIWDPTKTNPNSIMPPFGRHGMLSEKEIDDITEWVYGL